MQYRFYFNPENQAAKALADTLSPLLENARSDVSGLLIVLGGDGTVLRAIHELKPACPIWAVNCGHLGYLSDCEMSQAPALLSRILSGDYTLESRMLLKCTHQGKEYRALNEFTLHRGAFQHPLYLDLSVNGRIAMHLHGDGLILCTPTGSTAYNLSAGGPVLLPGASLMAITPICAHAPFGSPMVVTSQDKVTVAWHPSTDEILPDMPYLVVDGDERVRLLPHDTVEIAADSSPLRFIRTTNEDFCERLQNKLHMSPNAALR